MPPKKQQKQKYTFEQKQYLKQKREEGEPNLFPDFLLPIPSIITDDSSKIYSEFIKFFQNSEFYITEDTKKDEKITFIEKYSDKYYVKKEKKSLNVDFRFLPYELSGKSKVKRRRVEFGQGLVPGLNVEGEEEEKEGEEEPVLEEDEDENDYIQSYFDNGEGYGESDGDSGGEAIY